MGKRKRSNAIREVPQKKRKVDSDNSSSSSDSDSSDDTYDETSSAFHWSACVVCGEEIDDGEQLCRGTYCSNEPPKTQRRVMKSKSSKSSSIASDLERLLKTIIISDIALEKIMNGDYPSKVRNSLLIDYIIMQTRDLFSPEYFKYHNRIKGAMSRYDRLSPEERQELAKFHAQVSNIYVGEEQYELQLMRSELPIATKAIIMEKLRNYYDLPSTSEERGKLHIWLKYALNLPTQPKAVTIPEDFAEFEKILRAKLDDVIFGMDEVKERLLNMAFTQLQSADNKSLGTILALAGPPGIGKTYCAEILAKVLDRPFIRIGLGGVSDNSRLIGHSFTYVGAVPGEIVKGLHAAKCSNPVIYLDEIDKVSDKTADVNSILTLLLDSVQNHAFTDEYLGFAVDLSQVFWITSMNDITKVNHIVADRLEIINLAAYTPMQKMEIARKTLWPEACQKVGIQCELPEEMLKTIIAVTEKESGVRQLKRNLLTLLQTAYRRHVIAGREGELVLSGSLVDTLRKKDSTEGEVWRSIYL